MTMYKWIIWMHMQNNKITKYKIIGSQIAKGTSNNNSSARKMFV